ncbi:MAG: hypothetical protein QOH68_1632 [Nocardioidaceae bacterium]|nr:hypothetical protein [Nocardioidaceae bacterium]
MSSSRDVWEAVEPIHAVVYMAREARDAIATVGLEGFWPGYFASRGAALGAATPEVVEATFHGFPTAMVRAAMEGVWERTDPPTVLHARSTGAVAALRRVLGDLSAGDEVRSVARLSRTAAEGGTLAGRPLFAGLRAMAWSDDPLAAAWHGTSLLREHRGDGHVAVLTAAGVDGCASQVLAAARGVTTRELQRASRQWTEDAWRAAEERLRERRWLDAAGALTPLGLTEVDEIEARTDKLAEDGIAALSPAERDELVAAARVLACIVWASGEIPEPNPIGLYRPDWAR